MPDLAPESSRDTDDLVKTALHRWRLAEERERENRRLAYADLAFLAGDQWPAELRRQLEADGRPVLQFPRMMQFLRQVVNDIRLMRPSIKVVGVDDKSDPDTADRINGLIRYIENRSDAQTAYFIAGDQQVAAGIGHWQIVTEYAGEKTFDQEIRIMPIDDGIAVLWDPDAVLPTREDAGYCFQPIDLTRDAFKARFPNATVQDFAQASEIPVEGWVTEDYVRVARYWCKKPVKRKLAQLPDGSIVDMADEESAKAVAAAQAAGEKVRIEEREGHKVTHCLISSTEILEPEADWPGSYIPIVPVLGEEIRIGRKVDRRGIIRGAKDAQQAYNFAQTALIEAVAMQPKAPFLVTDEQVKPYAAEWLEANNKPLPYLRYKADGVAPPPSRVAPAIASQGLAEVVAMAGQDLKDVIGIQDAGLGQQGNETSGKAIIARQGESDVGMFAYIDNHSRAIRHTGAILVDLIPKIYDAPRTIRIMGEDGKVDKVAINQVQKDPATGEDIHVNDVTVGAYDVVVQQGPSFTTQREEAKTGMLEFAKMMGAESLPLFGDLLAKAQDWPAWLVEKLERRLKALLPPPIQAMEAEEAGEQPPPAAQPSPMDEAAVREATAKAAKAEIDVEIAKVELQLKQTELLTKQTDDRVNAAEAAKQLMGVQPQPVPGAAPVPGQQPRPVPQAA